MSVRKKLTIVVGAGASSELRLPTGSELKGQIAKLLDIRFEGGFRQISGDPTITDALRLAVRQPGGGSGDINPHRAAAIRIRDAMPQAISIDNFIDNHPGDAKIELCGKLAIVKSILDAERRSIIHTKPGYDAKINFGTADGCWLAPLMRLIMEHCPADELPKRLASLALVIFNYDRCIEYFLYHALQNYYGLSAARAADLLKEVEFLHPYGTVGKLPWQGSENVAEFGAELEARTLLNNARQIKTFTEGTDPTSSEIAKIRKAVSDCDTLLFLGFAYHRLNMRLLTPTRVVRNPGPIRNYGTAVGVSAYDCKEIATDLCAMRGCEIEDTVLHSDKTSKEIFGVHTRGISLL